MINIIGSIPYSRSKKVVFGYNMELFYTSAENPIYEYLTEREDGSWGAVEGESLLDQAYYLGSTLKVWVWRKKEDAESTMEGMSSVLKK